MTIVGAIPTPSDSWLDAAAWQRGDTIEIRGLHADGAVYRWWPAVVESVSAHEISVIWPAGTQMQAPTGQRQGPFRHNCRSIFWPDRLYFISETYQLDGELATLFADIAATRIADGRIEYVDYELDVVKPAGKPALVEDEDEFQSAATVYGYAEAFQARCRAALAEALQLVERWVPRGDVGAVLDTMGE